MENWEIAIDKFIKQWQNKKEVIGIIACGSYITGNPTKHSDIDVHIILDKDTKWKERGSKIINNILIEYFANPITKNYEYIENDYKNRKKIDAHMFSTGKIILDKKGELKKLKAISQKYLKRNFTKITKTELKYSKYRLWDMMDNLEEVYESNNDDFYFVFFNYLNILFDTYGKFLRFDSIGVHKILRFITNKKDKKKYNTKDFPDNKFVKMYTDILKIKDKSKMMKEYQKITQYILEKMGGFDVNKFKIKTKA